MNFDIAFETLIGHEGAFQNRRSDRGNWTTGIVGQGTLKGTKFGISAMSYPDLDIVNITLDVAKKIYLRDFWIPAGCEVFPDAIKFDMFDTAVNSGINRATLILQQAAGVLADSKVGPKTMAAIEAANPFSLHAKFNGYRLLFMSNLSVWDENSEGFAKRIAGNLING